MPQGVFRLRSAVLSAHLTCLSILQTVLPPAALSRFRGTGHSDRIQTLRALPSLCALSTTPEIPAPIQARSPEIRFTWDAQYMKIPRNPTGTLRFFRRNAHSGWNLDAFLPALPLPDRFRREMRRLCNACAQSKRRNKSPKNSAFREIKCVRRHRKIFPNLKKTT